MRNRLAAAMAAWLLGAMPGAAGAAPLPGLEEPAQAALPTALPGTGAPCQLELRLAGQAAWRGIYGRGYEPTAGETLEQTDVVVLHDGEPCQWYLTAERPADGAFLVSAGGGRLGFDVLQSPNGPSLLSDDVQGTTFSRLVGASGEGLGSQSLALFVSIPPGQVVRAGNYVGQAVIRLYRIGDGAPELVVQAPLAITTAVPSVLSVSSRDFTPGAAGGVVDLGSLEGGVSRTLGFDVTANADVSLTFQSANGGVLRHQAGARGIPYRLSASGRPISLDAAGTVERFVTTPETPLALDLRIDVDPQPRAAAGTYRDELVVTFRAEG
ncbi:hypothetical protein [Sphingomonas sp. IC4-52]|uniref:hypothetical protein n=1 Tax=Sphingomonas sp. IC4-52 TaxID=2887202 RepID=UPI001D102826|nr:hypothetical protein [Sphingomonas sp. IC4-52]MCC2981142.1 hypothetical protein [Sphingomonas sp. IC4-52]